MTKGIDLDHQIPWAMSDMQYQLITSKDMTPEQKEVAIRGNEAWIRLGLANRTKCSRCPRDYDEPSPNCVNFREHAAVSELAEGLEARDEAIMADLDHGLPEAIDEVVQGLDSKPVRRKKVA